jgi:PAS domain-containing protein
MAHSNTINTNGNDIESQLEELVAENRLLREQLSRSEETIAAHKQTEAALHEQVRRFSELLGLSLDWTWEMDATATYTYVSPNVRDFSAMNPRRCSGKPRSILCPHTRPSV